MSEPTVETPVGESPLFNIEAVEAKAPESSKAAEPQEGQGGAVEKDAQQQEEKPSEPSSIASSPDSPLPFAQLICDDGSFAPSSSFSLLNFHAQRALRAGEPSDAWAIVGIMGCQSTGKSTLLNALFGTQFREMDSKQGRSQTTRGVWLDSLSGRQLLVMDLEGTDSLERGEDRITFERQSSLLALALAEVLIINMWEHDLGRYTASNYGILHTVLQVNLQLFNPKSRTVLLFIIRDHIEEDTPLSAIQSKIRREVEEIWAGLRRPDNFADKKIDELFQFRFTALSHLKLQRSKFDQEIDELRKSFYDRSIFFPALASSGEAAKAAIPYQKSVPAKDFIAYTSNIWSAIRENAELNLPSQREMLAIFRADEAAQEVFKTFQRDLEKFQTECKNALLNDFHQRANALIDEKIHQFLEKTSYYDSEIVSKKRLEFLHRLYEELFSCFHLQLKFLIEKDSQEYLIAMEKEFPQRGDSQEISENFYKTLFDMKSSRKSRLEEKILQEYSLPDSGWKYDFFLEEWETRVHHYIEQEKTHQFYLFSQWMNSLISRPIQLEYRHLLQLKNNDDEIWNRIVEFYWNYLSQWLGEIQKKLQAFQLSSPSSSSSSAPSTENSLSSSSSSSSSSPASTGLEFPYYQEMAQKFYSFLYSSTEQYCENLFLYMKESFQRDFLKDSYGNRRLWKINENLQQSWDDAREKTESLLNRMEKWGFLDSFHQLFPGLLAAAEGKTGELLKMIPFEEILQSHGVSGKDGEKRLINEKQKMEILTNFNMEARAALYDAKLEQERSRQSATIPPWAIGLIAILGFDEFLAVLRNPLLFFLLLIIGGGLYVAWKMGMIGPLRLAAEKLLEQGMKMLEAEEKQTPRENNTATRESPASPKESNSNSSAASEVRRRPKKH